MKQKKMLTLTFSQLKQIYGQEIPEIVEIADKSSTVEDFKAGILRLLETCRIENEAAEEAREQIRLLLDYDGQNVHELSTGQDMSVQTIRLLYEKLCLCRHRSVSKVGMTGGKPDWMKRYGRYGMKIRSGCCTC